MQRTKWVLAATILAAAAFSPCAAQAMEIIQFDRMAIEDQGDYVQGLLQGAQEILMSDGKKDLAAQIYKHFTEVHQGDTISTGMAEFETYLAHLRALDAERHAKNHGVDRLVVEQAMILTRKRNGIQLPKSFMHVGDNFKPKQPSR